jgi:hypothetical protein
MLLTWVSGDPNDEGVYSIKITGTITTDYGTYLAWIGPFEVAVVAGCDNSYENPITVDINHSQCPLGTFTYIVSSPALIVPFTPFTEDSRFCDSNDIEYSLSISPPPPSGLFQIPENSNEVRIQSSSHILTDTTYSVSIIGSITALNGVF